MIIYDFGECFFISYSLTVITIMYISFAYILTLTALI